MTIRGNIFWTVDRIRGGHLHAELEDIRWQMATNDPAEVQRRIILQLEHATSNVPFYYGLRGAKSLSEFPVVDKSSIIDNFDETVARGVDTSILHVASTSGSTGTPFKVFHDSAKRRRSRAEVIYWGEIAGYKLGNPLVYIKLWTDRNRARTFSNLARNIVPVDTTRLNGNELLNKLEQATRRHSASIVSYSSSLEVLARAIEDHARTSSGTARFPRVSSIVAQSEPLAPSVRASLKRLLGVDPVGRYGLEELGIVAQQERDGTDEYRINKATHFVEVLKLDSAAPAGPGELGRIVVTELSNRAQPLIRYDTGDLGFFRVDPSGNEDREILAAIHGRRQDQVFDVNDAPLSPQVMAAVWWRFPDIGQYQLVQNGRADYLLRINAAPDFRGSDELMYHFRAVVGSTANIVVERVEEDFVLSSGKRKSVVSHYHPIIKPESV